MLSLTGSLLSAALAAALPEAAAAAPVKSKLPVTASPAGTGEETPGDAEPGQIDPYAEQAPLDVETIMTDSSKPYLQARARLESHPQFAAEAIHDRLAAVPAPGPGVRKRLFDVLATVARPQDLPLFAEELRRAVKTADTRAKADAYGLWRHLLLDQGARAAPVLHGLVGDRDLPADVRAGLLGDLIEVTPAADVGTLVVLVGRGRDDLGRTLYRGLSERARENDAAKGALTAAADTALDGALATPPDAAELERLPALLRFRASLGSGGIPLAPRLEKIANDDTAAFPARAASVRGLAVLQTPDSNTALQLVAQRHLTAPRRDTQSGEVLGWLAMKGLDEATAAKLASSLKLVGDDAPRLAAIGYTLASLPADKEAWLEPAMQNPWPQVRQAALERVEGPCEERVVGLLAKRGGASDTGGDSDRAAARAAVAALGRCGGDAAMRRLGRILDNTRIDMELRAEAARRLALHGGEDGANTVARQLSATSDRAMARRLAAALRKVSKATGPVDEALCDELRKPGEVARVAAETLRSMHEPGDEPCGAAQ